MLENSQSPKNDEIVTGDTAALEEPEQTSVSYVKGMFAGECEEQYGKNIGSDFLIVELDDTEEGIDWDTIRNLKCYVAEPAFTTEEIIYRMADFFWQDAEYTTSRESAVQRTSGQLTGWGDRYTCTEEISKEIIMGTNYGVSFMEGNKAIFIVNRRVAVVAPFLFKRFLEYLIPERLFFLNPANLRMSAWVDLLPWGGIWYGILYILLAFLIGWIVIFAKLSAEAVSS